MVLRNVYNTGTISTQKYGGGIIGGMYETTCNNFINAGTVKNISTENLVGDVVGDWGGDSIWENGTWIESTDTTSIENMKNNPSEYLGSNFKQDTTGDNNGFPILEWQ